MSQNPSRLQALNAARNKAVAAGFYVYAGSYTGAQDDRAGRWYVGRRDDPLRRPWGRGHRTQTAAWLAAAEDAEEHAALMAASRV